MKNIDGKTYPTNDCRHNSVTSINIFTFISNGNAESHVTYNDYERDSMR